MAKEKKEEKGGTKIKSKLNIDEVNDLLKYIVANNRRLQTEGKIPVAVDITGESGIGKTSVIIQLGQELGLPNFYKLNLAQIEELGDLVGFPIRQFKMILEKDEDGNPIEKIETWIDEHAVDSYTKMGYIFSGMNRMNYCPPQWISGRTGGGILMLDDWNRADMRFIQAVMELIDRQQYISWTLPKDWHIVLTSNPSGGDYLVQETDSAQATRSIGVDLKFDINCWAKWAEENGIDSRCINFMLMNGNELIKGDVNARSAVMFFNSISGIDVFEDKLPLIQIIGEGTVGDTFSQMFTMFINNKLDKLPTPDEIMNLKVNKDTIIKSIKASIGEDTKYRADIASTISTRLINYSLNKAKTEPITADYLTRLGDLFRGKIFGNDINYNTIKKIYNGNTAVFAGLTKDPSLVSIVLK